MIKWKIRISNVYFPLSFGWKKTFLSYMEFFFFKYTLQIKKFHLQELS